MQKKIGLVFDGGGGKGAYEIGVWQSLCECGLDKEIAAVSGASVGGLNAALFVHGGQIDEENHKHGGYEKAVKIWGDLHWYDIFGHFNPKNRKRGKRDIHLSRRGLAKIIDENLNEEDFNKNKPCYVSCRNSIWNHTESYFEEYSFLSKAMNDNTIETIKFKKITYFNLSAFTDPDERKKLLLATSAMPLIFPKEEIKGNIYFDGGFGKNGDNSPVYPLYHYEKCNIIIVVRLDSAPKKRKRIDKSKYPDAAIIEIVPGPSLGKLLKGTLNFSEDKINELIKLGHEESKKLLSETKNLIDIHERNEGDSKEFQKLIAGNKVIEMGLRNGLSVEEMLNELNRNNK